jgi:hypothetical protein
MAPLAQYRVPSASEEIALSRTAAPTSISGDASVLTLGEHGYETTARGKPHRNAGARRGGFHDVQTRIPGGRRPPLASASDVFQPVIRIPSRRFSF